MEAVKIQNSPSTQGPNPALKTRPAIYHFRGPTPFDRDIRALHHKVYIEELGYLGGPKNGAQVPSVHPESDLFVAYSGTQLIGTLEMIPAPSFDEPSHSALIDELTSRKQGRVTVGSKLIVDPLYRGRLGSELMKAAYRQGLENDVRYCVLECYDHLVPLYEKFGFIKTGQKTESLKYGAVNTLVLDYQDEGQFKVKRSPFLEILRSFKNQILTAKLLN